jgi:hypothetical protein
VAALMRLRHAHQQARRYTTLADVTVTRSRAVSHARQVGLIEG